MKRRPKPMGWILAGAALVALLSCGDGSMKNRDQRQEGTSRTMSDQQTRNPKSQARAEVTFHVGGMKKTVSGAT